MNVSFSNVSPSAWDKGVVKVIKCLHIRTLHKNTQNPGTVISIRVFLNNIFLSGTGMKAIGYSSPWSFSGLKGFSLGGIVTMCLIALAYGFLWILSPFCIPMFQPLVLFNKRCNVKSTKALLSDITSWMFFRYCDTTVSAATTPLTTRERLSLSFSSGFASVVRIEGGLPGYEESYGADFIYLFYFSWETHILWV